MEIQSVALIFVKKNRATIMSFIYEKLGFRAHSCDYTNFRSTSDDIVRDLVNCCLIYVYKSLPTL